MRILAILTYITSRIDSFLQESAESLPVEQSEPSKSNDFKTFIFFSVLTTLTAKYLFNLYKRGVVGDSPFTDLILADP